MEKSDYQELRESEAWQRGRRTEEDKTRIVPPGMPAIGGFRPLPGFRRLQFLRGRAMASGVAAFRIGTDPGLVAHRFGDRGHVRQRHGPRLHHQCSIYSTYSHTLHANRSLRITTASLWSGGRHPSAPGDCRLQSCHAPARETSVLCHQTSSSAKGTAHAFSIPLGKPYP